MAYSGVYVFGDSLVDSGNALKLAETYDYFPFTSLPDGAPTPEKGYHSGNFTNGWTLVDLISNKYLGVATKTVFPFGYDDPFLGISFGFVPDPDGNNLNFAYGGAQLRQGDEAVPDIDDQTDAFRDAVDGDADPNALHIFSFGANDVHDLISLDGGWATRATAEARLSDAAGELIEEIMQIVDIGARHIVVVGVPDIGIQPMFNGTPNEAARRAVATEYSELLDQMIQDRLAALDLPDGVEINYVSFEAMQGQVIGTMADLYGEAAIFPLDDSSLVFFDQVHPTAQVHALGAAYVLDQLNGTSAGDQMALTAPDYSAAGSIAIRGEVDTITVSLASNTSYTFNLLGLSTLGGNVAVLADPMIMLFGPSGTLLGSNDDGGVGLDASFTFTSGAVGDYTIQLSGVGSMAGTYTFQAAGQAVGDDNYVVSHAGAIILEHADGGFDAVRSSVSYALNPEAEVEVLRTGSDKGKSAINLTGNDFGQTIVGNAGNNIIEGRGGADTMIGGAGKDVFVLSSTALTSPGAASIDRISDYGSGDIVDISQILGVTVGTDVISGGYARVTTSGLVQVDLDGGGNNWVTLSTINNGGAVTIRYLSGGFATSLSMSRVAATSMASAVAAAGLAAPLAAQPADSADSLSMASLTAVVGANIDIAHRSEVPGRSLLAGDTRDAAETIQLPGTFPPKPAVPGQEHSLTGIDLAPKPLPPEHASAFEPADHMPATSHTLTAPAVAMPSAEALLLVAELAAPAVPGIAQEVDVLPGAPPDVDALLAALPGGGLAMLQASAMNEVAARNIEALAIAPAQLPMEVLAMHPDGVQAA